MHFYPLKCYFYYFFNYPAFFQLSGLLLLSNNHMGHKISRAYKREGYYRSIDKLYFLCKYEKYNENKKLEEMLLWQ